MTFTDGNILENYLGLLKNLNSNAKLEIIAMLSNSMKTPKKTKAKPLKSLYGAFVSVQSADEIIAEIKQSRVFTREREEL